MKKSYLIAVFIFMSFFISCNRDVETSLNFKNVKSQEKNRKFIDEPKKIKKIKLKNLYDPFIFNIYKNYVFICDFSSLLIHRISLTDTTDYLIFGNGKGHGPGELINPMCFNFFENFLYVSDAVKQSFEVYSLEGKYIRSIKLNDHSPYRTIINRNSRTILFINNYNNEHIFCKTDINGNKLKEFGKYLINKEKNSSIYHETNICQISDSSFIQLPIRLGVMGYYKNDSLLFIKETIDGYQKKTNVIITGTSQHADRDNYLYTSFQASSDGTFLLLTKIESKNGVKNSCFDLYKKNSLDYLYSFKLPEKIKGIIIDENYFVTYNDTEIAIWEKQRVLMK